MRFRHPARPELEHRRLAGNLAAVIILGELDLDLFFLAGLDAFQAFLEFGQHLPGADFDRHILTASAVEYLAVDAALEIHHYLVTLLCRAVDLAPGLALGTQFLEHVVEVRVLDFDHGLFDLDGLEFEVLDFGVNLEGRGKRHVFLFLATDRVDARHARRTHLLLDQGFLVARLDDVADDFLAHVTAELLLHYLERYLTRPETVYAHGLAQVSELLFDRFGNSLGRNLYRHPAFQTLEGFD